MAGYVVRQLSVSIGVVVGDQTPGDVVGAPCGARIAVGAPPHREDVHHARHRVHRADHRVLRPVACLRPWLREAGPPTGGGGARAMTLDTLIGGVTAVAILLYLL